MEYIEYADSRTEKKTGVTTEREITTGLVLLRCCQLGLSMSDLDYLDMGMVYDMIIEQANDSAEDAYDTVRNATQADFDNF